MSSQDTAPQRRAINSANPPANVSRRRLLTSGAAVAAVATLPALARENQADDRAQDDGTRRGQPTDEQRRLAAILELYGPELGSGR